MKNKPTKTIWVTRDGQRIPVKQMSTKHLENTIAMLTRIANHYRDHALISMYGGLSTLNGEMAIDVLESEIRYMEDARIVDILEDRLGCDIFTTMEIELRKRNES